MSPTRRRVLRYLSQRRTPPALREIASGVDRSITTVCLHLDALIAAGLAEKQPGKHRSIRITKQGLEALERSS